MARPIKQLQASADALKELRRRSRSTTIGMREKERAEIVLLHLGHRNVSFWVEIASQDTREQYGSYGQAQNLPFTSIITPWPRSTGEGALGACILSPAGSPTNSCWMKCY
jgi:hypothetical protein